jgi:ribose transport system ATP-binding protein
MPIVELVEVSKSYGGAAALSGVSFACESGKIHAVLGENGAGKSTLMRLMAGVIRPTSGEIRVDGAPVAFSSPRDAKALGIVCMFQELSLVPDLTAAQNIVLARSDRVAGFVRSRSFAAAAAALDRVGASHVPLDVPVRDLSLADKQLVEIAKALHSEPRVLILDEATSALTKDQVERVFAVLRDLKARGVAILFISHRLYEVDAIADVVSIFRNGRHVATFPAGSRNRDEVVALMVGQPLTEFYPDKEPVTLTGAATAALRIRQLSWGRELRGVDLDIRPGEIVGVGGLDGQGQQHLLHALFGILKGVTGEITLDGQPLPTRPDLVKRFWPGIALVPEDRKTEGLILPLSIRDNLRLAALDNRPFGLMVGRTPEDERGEEALASFELVFRSFDEPVGALSGGNQQKVAIAKWLALSPRLLLLMDPTRGIDVRSKAQIYRAMRALAANGTSILWQSTDHEELVHLCDEVHVFYRGRINATLAGASLTSERLVAACLNLVDHEEALT